MKKPVYTVYTILFVFAQKPTNFGSWQMVRIPFADGAAHVRSPIHTYTLLVHKLFVNGLVRKCVPAFTCNDCCSASHRFGPGLALDESSNLFKRRECRHVENFLKIFKNSKSQKKLRVTILKMNYLHSLHLTCRVMSF